jgi:phage terminase small subunit
MKEKRETERTPEPPPGLSERSQALWRELAAGGRVGSIGRQVMLQAALEALDRATEARRVVQRDGMTTTSPGSGVVHVHPLVKVEAEARRQFGSLWAALGLTWDADVDGRMSGNIPGR